jgi:flagellar biosynthesis chaperone FliJ
MHHYAYNLHHLAGYYRQYQRLMQHWKKTLRLPIMEVSYEELVTNQAKLSRDIVEFCDLPWEEGCMHFYETTRAVATCSYDQVRQPIYHRSVSRWRNYQQFLEPLIQTFADSSRESS